MDVGIIINPVAGSERPSSVIARTGLARDVLRECELDGEVRLTEGRGSARAAAAEMIDAGVTSIIAWGGDGTVNEVATEVSGADVILGVVPGGSGNGFARGLGLEKNAREALYTALNGEERLIDTGCLGGRLFVNVAGVGFDAHLASVFNRLPLRGAAMYTFTGIRELLSYRASSYTVKVGSNEFTTDAFLVAVANGREYGSGAIIAPNARIDDGKLDLVCIPPRPLYSVFWQARRLFSGNVDQISDVQIVSAPAMEIIAGHPLVFHVDGEVYYGPDSLQAIVCPASLRVRVPSNLD